MAEEWEVYRVNGDTSQPADNVRVLPVRGFTQVDNAYYDGLLGKVSPTAYYCLTYIVRNTLGYHRQGVRLSFKQLGDALGLSRNTAMRGIQELEAARIIGSDGGERGRTQVRAYFLLPIEGWTLDSPCSTSAKTELDTTSPKSALVVSKIALVGAQTSPKIGHLRNKERKKLSKQTSCPMPDGTDTAVAPSVPAAPPAPPAPTAPTAPSKPSAPSKTLSEDSDAVQLAAYLRDRILAHSPNARDAKAALLPAKLHQWARLIDLMLRVDGRTPDGIRAVIDFATTDSFWQSNILSPGKLREQYDRLEARMRTRRTTVPPTRAPQREPALMPRRDVPLNAKPAKLV
jgi:hypothetical protein